MMNRFKLFVGSFIIFSFALLGLQADARAYNIPEYFPLSQEDYWVYSIAEGEQSYEMDEIDGTEIINGVMTIRKEEEDNINCFAWDLEGLRWYKQEFDNNEYMIFDTPVLIFLAQMEIDQQLTASVAFSSYRDGQVYRTASADLMRTLVAVEEVTVPAGTFTDCLKFTEEVSWQYSDGGSGREVQSFWLTQGIGEVKGIRIITISEGGSTNTETQEKELVFANVGGNTYGQNVVGRITGHVYRTDKITPISGALVEIFKIGEQWASDTQALTVADGSYSFFLAEGDYIVRVSAAGYAREYYDNVIPSHEASVVHVSPDSEINIEFDLNEGGAISGHIYKSETGNPVAEAEVIVHPNRYQNDAGFRALTEADGSYTVGGLALGDYAVRVQATGYILEYYGGSYNYWTDLPPVRVIPPDTTPNINIYIEEGGSISGYVYDNNGLPLEDVHVLAQGRTVESGAGANTDSFGHYMIEGLAEGGFFVRVYGPSLPLGLAPEHYDGIYRHGEGDIVEVQKGLDTSGINFTLEPGGAISGHVYDEETGLPLSGIGLFAYLMEDGHLVMTASGAWTDELGYYRLNTTSESHVVGISWDHVGHNRGYLAELYDDVLAGADSWNNPGPVTLIYVQANQETMDIDFSLQKGGSISGHIYKEDGVTPIGGANVYAFPEDPQILGSGASSQPDGSYKIECLFSGWYTVQVTVSDYESASAQVTVNSPEETSGIDFLLTEAESELSEENSIETTLTETLVSQQAHLSNLTVSGDLSAAIDVTDLEVASIATGSFAGQGFYKAECQLDLGDLSYTGEWAGVFLPNPEEKKIYFDGAVSGEIAATVEGYVTESVPDSGNYDLFEATWKIGALGNSTLSATLQLSGTFGIDNSSEFPETELYVLQTNFEGNITGHYAGSLSTVLTHIRVVSPQNPYYEEGFSIISYTSELGSGQFWTYDNPKPEGTIGLVGLSTSPLFGIIYATLDESTEPRTLTVEGIERIDLGLPPAPDLKVEVFGLRRVSPGQTIDYVVEYRNDGFKAADDCFIILDLPETMEYISNTGGGIYYPISHSVIWQMGNTPQRHTGFVSAKTTLQWGLPQNTAVETVASISNEDIDMPIDPFGSLAFEAQEGGDGVIEATGTISTETGSHQFYITLSVGDVVEGEVEPVYEINLVPGGVETFMRYGVETNSQLPVGITQEFSDDALDAMEKIRELYDINRLRLIDQEFAEWLRERNFIDDKWLSDLQAINRTKYTGMMKKAMFYIMQLLAKSLGQDLAEKVGKEIGDFANWLARSYADAITGARLISHLRANLDFIDFLAEEGYDIDNVQLKNIIKWYYENVYLKEHADDRRKFDQESDQALDPNIKYGPEGDVSAGQKLDYRVEYENEGPGIAFGVYFTDTLDEDLDDSTLEVGPVISTINSSEIAPAGTYNPATRTITWLVGEVGPGEGGYSDLSVNVRSDAQPGTEIINFATVYFPSVPEATRTNGIVSIIPIVSENQLPVANAGSDQTVIVGTDGMVMVILDGSVSYDPDEDSLTYTWTWDGGSATGVSPTIQLERGDYTITLVVNDGTDDSEPDIVHISAIDITPPEISLSVSPDTLWPPNHKMVLVTPTVAATDNCDPDPGIELQSVIMNEADETNTYNLNLDSTAGDGHTIDDIRVDENGNMYLRAERAGGGTGRIYTITYVATDSSGNSATASATVTVPHSQ